MFMYIYALYKCTLDLFQEQSLPCDVTEHHYNAHKVVKLFIHQSVASIFGVMLYSVEMLYFHV